MMDRYLIKSDGRREGRIWNLALSILDAVARQARALGLYIQGRPTGVATGRPAWAPTTGVRGLQSIPPPPSPLDRDHVRPRRAAIRATRDRRSTLGHGLAGGLAPHRAVAKLAVRRRGLQALSAPIGGTAIT